ncbi:MAG: hypothetical protein JO251_22480 [Verrucomicrobia bacterium]|nr:hypothetical protein [Verrucomicrobiota bacterium]
MMLNRSTRRKINCKSYHRILALLVLLVGLPLSTNADQFCLILDPYFYRSPIRVPLQGTTQTVLAYYRILDAETLAPAKLQELTAEAQSAVAQENLDRARRLLAVIRPEIIRDSNGVITALRVQSSDPTLSAILLLPELGNRFANLLGPDCYFAVPNRRTIFFLPRLATDIQSFAPLVHSLYHNDPWPISTEIFEIVDGKLRAHGQFNDDF